jgi:DNA-binding PadR family transcriptional regulator
MGSFELMVMLALMRLRGEAYGVPIAAELTAIAGRPASLGSVYAALQRLEGKGLVASEAGEPTAVRGGKAKRYFSVTPKGLQEVRSTQRALMSLWTGIRALKGTTA